VTITVEKLARWAPIEAAFRRRRNAAWGWAAVPVAGPDSEARTPPARVGEIEAEWDRAFCAFFGVESGTGPG